MSNDNSKPNRGAGSNESGFVMPENDQVNSGHPIGDTAYHASSGAVKSNDAGGQRVGAEMDKADNASAVQGMGLTIKSKLLGSFLILTLVIGFLGIYSYSTLVQVSDLSRVVAQDQAELAKLAEKIKTTVFKIRDAEKDYTYLHEQESLDRVQRYTAQARDELKEMIELVDGISKKTGKSQGEQFDSIKELIESYESQFSVQVRGIREGQKTEASYEKNVRDSQEKLLGQVEANLLITENLVGDYWISLKQQLSSNTDAQSNTQKVTIGVMLSNLQQALLNLQIQTAKYFDTRNTSYADSSRGYILDAKEIAKNIRLSSSNDKVGQKMESITTNLVNYAIFFNDVVASNIETNRNSLLTAEKIKNQLTLLQDTSNKLFKEVESISSNSWGQISELSQSLATISSKAQFNLSILAAIGTLVGVVVLIWIPRPILNGINQLLLGAQRVAAGDLTQSVSLNTRDELGVLSETFERMRNNLQSLVLRSQNVSVQITSGINEIQAAANQQSATANEQAATINQFKATMGEMSRTANELSSLVSEINAYAEKVSEHVNLSNDKSSQLLDSMGAISESTQQTSGRIKSLNDQMDTINDAVSVISGVADQTTLLSMNASIEANKAGEMGKGFSVVAYEIRRLSDRAIDSAGDITGKVRDIQRATENSVVAMDKSSEEIRVGISQVQDSTDTLSNINSSLSSIREQMNDMSAGTKDQAAASNQAEQSAVELAKSSQMVSSAAKQTVTAAYEINAMANQLAESVAAFRT